ncbi:MAG TPA: hypothetical protein PKH24_11675 [Sedimentisphaerales bacterium]|jgi:hypothetical protein|nr:hypothetical protein [Sedimentisphaerales bacterium]HNU29605.1 hypothetical protein [Sedimentisphaerales bacterium]
MTHMKPVRCEGPGTVRNQVRNSANRTTWGFAAGICLAGVVLAWSPSAIAGNGPGLAFKIGAQTLEAPLDKDKTTRARFEVEIATPRLLDDHIDLAFAFGGSSLGSYRDRESEEVDGVYIVDRYSDDLSIIDIRLAARVYPLGDATKIRPYLGAGIGYFWFLDAWEYEHRETFDDPYFPGEHRTYIDEYEDTETMASGLFAFATAGVTFPIGSRGELILEFQYDFEKEDDGFDLGGPIYMIGGRFRF